MSRGGSRFGAGRRGWRAKVENLRNLRIRTLARAGYLRPGISYAWGWWRDGQQVASIGASVDAVGAALRLAYTLTAESGEARDCVQLVPLTYTPCHFGGSRLWFGCPVCGRRVGLLLMRAGRFACRHCQRAAYACQSEDWLARNWRKQSRIEARLGENWARPKGMRHATHDALVERICDLEEQREAALAPLLARLLQR